MRHFLFLLMVLVVFSVTVFGQQTTAVQKYTDGNSLIADGKYTKAVEVLDRALGETADSKKAGRELRADILLALGKAHYYAKEFEIAESKLKDSASEREGKNSETYVFMGLVQLGLDDKPAATLYLNMAIATDPKNAEAWYELGKLLNAEGNKARAKVALDKAIELGSERVDF